jgi:hypothetical protein
MRHIGEEFAFGAVGASTLAAANAASERRREITVPKVEV